MAARLHMNQAMLVWAGSAVRVEEAFPDAEEQEESDHARHTDAEGFQKRIPANTRLQLYWHDSNNGQRHVCGRAIEVGEFEMVVETEKPVPCWNRCGRKYCKSRLRWSCFHPALGTERVRLQDQPAYVEFSRSRTLSPLVAAANRKWLPSSCQCALEKLRSCGRSVMWH